MTSPLPPTRLLIAAIGPAHGVRGQVKMRLYLDDPDLLKTMPAPYTSETGTATLKIKLIKPIPNGWIASIDNITDRDAAEKCRGQKLYIDRDVLPALDETDDDSTYYTADLVGLQAHDINGTVVGTVMRVDNFGASDLLDIKPTSGLNFYLPFTDEYVPNIDLKNSTLTIQDYAPFLPDVKDPVEK